MSRSVLPRMRNVSDKSCRENQNTHFKCNNFFLLRNSCRLWDNVEKYGTARQAIDGNIILLMLFACWITKATNTHSEYVILITLHLHIVCLVTKSSLNHVITLHCERLLRKGKNFEFSNLWEHESLVQGIHVSVSA